MSFYKNIESILKAYPQLDSAPKEFILNAAKVMDSILFMKGKEACQHLVNSINASS